MKTILFQGDSITDAGRPRDNDNYLGMGYPEQLASQLGFENPGEYKFINRGISGNRIVDLYARIKMDIINLKPDVMSILIGVNDVWHEINDQNGVDAEKFEKIYTMLIEEIKAALPDLKIMIFGPYVCKGYKTTDVEGKWETFSAETAKRAAAAKRIAEKFGLTYVPLQERFDEVAKIMPEEYWTADGVHPTSCGHALIKNEWLKAYKAL